MTDPKLVFPGLLVLFSISGAQAQVTIDVWLHGYYSAKRGNTIVDTQQFKANVQKVTQYCRLNSGVTAYDCGSKPLLPGAFASSNQDFAGLVPCIFWHCADAGMPEETVSTGKVRSLGITGRVENVPLPPSLTHFGLQSCPRQ